MNKILQIKIYKILMGVMVFLCATYVFSLDVYAGYGMGFRDANGNDTNQISGTKVKIIANSWGNDTFKNAYIVYCSNVYEQNERLVKTYIEKYRSENTGIQHIEQVYDITGWHFGVYSCKIGFQLLNGKEKYVSATFTKLKPGKCEEFSTPATCNVGYIDTGSACSWRQGTTSSTVAGVCESTTGGSIARGTGYYACGNQCVKYNKGDKLGSNCGTSMYGTQSLCEKTSGISGSRPSTGGSTTTTKSTGPTGTTYTVLFDENYGYGLACDAGFISPNNGVCSKSGIKAGETVSYPSTSAKMTRDAYYLVGWTNVVTNGKPDCSSGVIKKNLNEKYKVNANTDFYACYEEYINGTRYVFEGAAADGGSAIKCGSSVKIEYCTKENEGNFCYFNDGTLRKVYRDKLANTVDAALATCNNKNNAGQSSVGQNQVQDKGERFVLIDYKNFQCGDKLYITTCTETVCKYTKIIPQNGQEFAHDGTINRVYLDDNESDAKKTCSKLKEEEDEFDGLKSCSGNYANKSKDNMTGTQNYAFCYKETDSIEERNDKIKKMYSCKKGSTITSIHVADDGKDCNDNGICFNSFSITCSSGKPTLVGSTGLINGNNKVGYINVEASAQEGSTIEAYYVSEIFKTPIPGDSKWVKTNNNKFTIESSPGVKYIWVMDSNGNVSDAIRGVVLDTVNNDTTAKDVALYDENGNLQALNRTVAYDTKGVTSSKYVMLSNQLKNDSEVIADGFNPYDMEYKIEVESPTVSVYVTLTSTDSKYVPGYEPRTVNLEYGVNTILIKIQNKEGTVRTYTILATRTDDRDSDNTLNDLKLSVGEINFNSNVAEYKVEIPESTKNVNVEAKIGSDTASYVAGYEPGNVRITGNTTVKLIKVISQTGSTRTYVITFVKKGTDKITKESLQLEEIAIPNVNLPFESEVANYNVSVAYEQATIDLVTTLKNKDSIVSISLKRKNESNYSLTSGKGINLDVGENFIEIKVIDNENEVSYYRITVIRKEFGLDVSNDTTLKNLSVLGYDIKFEPNKKEYTVRIKKEKSLVITAVPNSNRAEVFIRGNDELTGFSTVRVKVVSENGEFETYSIDIKKDAFNKTIEIASIVAGVVIILVGSGIIIVKKKSKSKREYFEE